jgi:hypothetical protein
MLLFRSEAHITRWLDGRPPGRSTSIGLLCELAHAWWGDRLAATWQPRSRADSQAILDRLGLTDAFWRLPG